MKKQLLEAYLTGAIESSTSLLDFVADLSEKENSEGDIIAENSLLRKRITELEESCTNMNEVERNLHEQIETTGIRYRTQLSMLECDMDELKVVNTGVWEENRQIKLLNRQSFRKIKVLKNKLKNKLKGDC